MYRNIFIGLLLTCLAYLFFWSYLPEQAWFWTLLVFIGSTLFFTCLPNNSISEGALLLPLNKWIVIIVVPIFIIVFPTNYLLKARIVMAVCFFIFEIGTSVFSKITYRKIKIKIAEIKSSNASNG